MSGAGPLRAINDNDHGGRSPAPGRGNADNFEAASDALADGRVIEVLLVEDRADDAILARRALVGAKFDCNLAVETSAESAMRRLFESGSDFDVVVVDYTLPGMDGLELSRRLLERGLATPIIFVTGTGSEDVAVEALRLGVVNYLVKDEHRQYLDRLQIAVVDAVMRDAQARRLRDSERRRRLLVEASLDAVVAIDAAGDIVEFNPAAEAMFSLPKDAALGRNVHRLLVPARERRRHTDGLERANGKSSAELTGGRTEMILQRTDGVEFPADVMLLTLEESRVRTYTALIRDVAAERRAAAQLESGRRILDETLKGAALAHWIWDDSQRRVRADLSGLERLFGGELAARFEDPERFCILVHEEDRDAFRDAFEALRRDGAGAAAHSGLLYRVDVPGRGWRWFESRLVPEPPDGQAAWSFLGIVQDVTERHEAELRLEQGRRLESLGQLTGGVAHDFNNLLAVIRGNLELMRRKLGADDEHVKSIDTSLRASERGAELTQRLLSFARQRPTRPEVVDVNEHLKELRGLLARTLGPEYVVTFVPGNTAARIEVDAGQFDDALLNLALNARDAMAGGGNLVLRVEPGDGPQAPRPTVRILVEDDGGGMTEEARQRAFEPFFTTKALGQGSGLGLSMVYGFVQQAGGSADLTSLEGHGTTVILEFPTTMQEVARRGRESDVVGAAAAYTVLVVEDDPDVRQVVSGLVRSLGYVVLTASDGQEALGVLGAQRVDLLLTDIMMPGGMNGFETAERAQALNSDLTVIFMSGHSEGEAALRASASAAPMLRKPFEIADLAELLYRASSQT